MKSIAVIPARSGSKGLPDKNIRLLNGVPLLAYSIKAALDTGAFDTVMVSTDSEKYAEIARSYGAEVPFLRSEKNSGDKSASWDVVKEVLLRYSEMGRYFDTVALLQPTSPLRMGKHITEAFQVMDDKQANAVIALCENDAPFAICNILPEDHCIVDFLNERGFYPRRQALQILHRPNGSIYLYRTEALHTQLSIYDAECYAYVMDKTHSIDVDTIEDFQIVEALVQYLPEFKGYFV